MIQTKPYQITAPRKGRSSFFGISESALAAAEGEPQNSEKIVRYAKEALKKPPLEKCIPATMRVTER